MERQCLIFPQSLTGVARGGNIAPLRVAESDTGIFLEEEQ